MENILNNNNDVRTFLDAANVLTNGLNKSKDKLKILKIDKHLPQIIVPENKTQMFIDWWNSDIRFEKSIPHSFDEGYMIIDNVQGNMRKVENYGPMIKAIAKELNTTYRHIENMFKEFMENSKQVTIHFKFLSDNEMFIETYDTQNRLMSNMSFAVGESDAEDIIDLNKQVTDEFDNVAEYMNYIHLGILVSCLWYIATAKKTTKYIYEKRVPQIVGRQKGVVQVSDTKFISTPIYDIGKTRTVKVEHLQKRKNGWTYSHAFQVHGHYRHYKDGKVIFINPYIKGKDKEFKAQQFILTPEDVST